MMQLVTIASFFVLLYNFFGTIAAPSDHNAITDSNVDSSVNDDFIFNLAISCIFGVKSVSTVLYTSNIPNGKIVQVNESCNLIDPSKPVFFMTHGFLSNSLNYNFPNFASLLSKKDYAVFSLDWSNAACYNRVTATMNLLEYPLAVRNTREVGTYLASYIKSVMNVCNVPLKKITLIGHSLGAHISSFAAKNLQKSNYGKIPLLIGTDPAGPSFLLRDCEDRFCKTDAERVVALHSSLLGIQKSVAHLNLWFNNGISQPACPFFYFNCSHNIAVEYLATLLDNCVYIGVPVSSRTFPFLNVMSGYSSDITRYIVVDSNLFDDSYSTIGDYCVFVTSKYPYYKKKNKLKDLSALLGTREEYIVWEQRCDDFIESLEEQSRAKRPRLLIGKRQSAIASIARLESLKDSMRGRFMHVGAGYGLRWREIDTAFENRILTGAVINYKHSRHIEPHQFLENAREIVFKRVRDAIERHGSVKVNTAFNGDK
ncbi:phospholipase A1 [Mycetomoellerius zeteki]|uniref:phospholipase A1 n=1 Tax=Mycetomoellerius zeteki TaxID=64791 RepID=UPI00084E3E3F|nr:PREDICTED: phospholipase A1-like [Trachymyrmex zeteki]